MGRFQWPLLSDPVMRRYLPPTIAILSALPLLAGCGGIGQVEPTEPTAAIAVIDAVDAETKEPIAVEATAICGGVRGPSPLTRGAWYCATCPSAQRLRPRSR